MTPSSHILEPDAQAILLLCGRLGSHDDSSVKPLTRNQYNKVANWLHNLDLRPAALLNDEGRDRLSKFGDQGKVTEARLRRLLERGAALAMAVEEWTNKGGWILTRSDADYPTRFRRRLKLQAPPILYGIGDPKLLEYGGVSMVGSRDSDDASLAFVRDLARRCAQEGVTVVSGGARGVDQASMDAALETGGIVVGALANGLAKTSRKKKYREAIADNRLTLVSAYHPNSRFQVWKAMNRNKHIYALGDGTVVAHSAVGSGGTWAGATENLKHEWVPLFVLAKPPIPEGNQKLIEMGGFPIDRRVLQEGVRITDWLSGDVSPAELTPMATRLAGTSAIDPSSSNSAEDASSSVEVDVNSLLDEQDEPELFALVWPALKTLLDEARSEQEVREYFSDLRLGQARDWLTAAVDRGLAIRTERPVRYELAATDDAEDEIGSGGSEESDEEINQSVEGNSADSDPNSDGPSEVNEMRNASSEAPDLFSESG